MNKLEATTYWDQLTGVAVEENTMLTDFTMITTAERTSRGKTLTKGYESFPALFVKAAASMLLVVLLMLRVQRKKVSRNPNDLTTRSNKIEKSYCTRRMRTRSTQLRSTRKSCSA